jgi:hypothetical protein
VLRPRHILGKRPKYGTISTALTTADVALPGSFEFDPENGRFLERSMGPLRICVCRAFNCSYDYKISRTEVKPRKEILSTLTRELLSMLSDEPKIPNPQRALLGRRKGERGRHHVGWTRDGLGGPGTT